MKKQDRKNVPALRFKGFEEEWEEKKLGDTIDYNSTGIRACDADSKGEYDLYDANEIVGKVSTFAHNHPYVSIIKDGSGVGRVRLLPANTNCLGTMGIISSKDNNDINFIFSHLQTKDFSKHIISGAIPHVYFRDYGEDKFDIPRPDEQQKLGSFFKELDELISAKEEELEKLRQLKAALLDAMFPSNDATSVNRGGYMLNSVLSKYTQLEVHPDTPNSPRLRFRGYDEEWKKKKINDIANINPPNHELEESFYYIDLESVEKGRLLYKRRVQLKKAPSRAQRTLSNNDVLFQTVRPYQRNHYIHQAKFDNTQWVASTGFAQLRPMCYPYFLFVIINTEKVNEEVILRCTGTAYPAIRAEDLGTIEIFIPSSLSEQQQIGNFFRSQDEGITVVEEQIMKLKMVKQACLQQMFV